MLRAEMFRETFVVKDKSGKYKISLSYISGDYYPVGYNSDGYKLLSFPELISEIIEVYSFPNFFGGPIRCKNLDETESEAIRSLEELFTNNRVLQSELEESGD